MFVPVHPRACGEWDKNSVSRMINSGSSPRMGTPRYSGCTYGRFIPAPAGNGRLFLLAHLVLPVHPRACGEWAYQEYQGLKQDGSSPRLRGMGRWRLGDMAGIRFIPAPAGNGTCARSSSDSLPVHPRACGEWTWMSLSPSTTDGSSPRLRGMGKAYQGRIDTDRFIPAPAGNGGTGGGMTAKDRFIPAPAGNGDLELLADAEIAVHPRACGEWGHRGGMTAKDRFIPAPAGNGDLELLADAEIAVHPRACGEWGHRGGV